MVCECWVAGELFPSFTWLQLCSFHPWLACWELCSKQNRLLLFLVIWKRPFWRDSCWTHPPCSLSHINNTVWSRWLFHGRDCLWPGPVHPRISTANALPVSLKPFWLCCPSCDQIQHHLNAQEGGGRGSLLPSPVNGCQRPQRGPEHAGGRVWGTGSGEGTCDSHSCSPDAAHSSHSALIKVLIWSISDLRTGAWMPAQSLLATWTLPRSWTLLIKTIDWQGSGQQPSAPPACRCHGDHWRGFADVAGCTIHGTRTPLQITCHPPPTPNPQSFQSKRAVLPLCNPQTPISPQNSQLVAWSGKGGGGVQRPILFLLCNHNAPWLCHTCPADLSWLRDRRDKEKTLLR